MNKRIDLDQRKILIFIIVYALIVLILGSISPYYTSDGPERTMAAIFVDDVIKDIFQGDISSFADIEASFIDFYSHYTMFAGVGAWPPLHLMITSLLFLVLGTSKLVTLLPQYAFLTGLLWFVYLTIKENSDSKIHWWALAIIMLHPTIMIWSGMRMLGIGSAFFIWGCIFYALRFIRKNEKRSIYALALLFSLGMLYKFETVLILPPLAFLFLINYRLKTLYLLLKKYWKHAAISIAIFLIIMSPVLIGQAILKTKGISTLSGRVTKHFFLFSETEDASGWLSLTDYFRGYSETEHKDLYFLQFHSFNAPLIKVFYFILTVVFFQWVLIPFFIAGNIQSLKRQNRFLIFLLGLIGFYILFYLFWVRGAQDRYFIPIIPAIAIVSVQGLHNYLKKKSHIRIATTGIVIILLIQLVIFIVPVYSRMISNTGPVYEITRYILDDQEGEFTVMVTHNALKAQALSFLKTDTDRRVYLVAPPVGEEQVNKQLSGEDVDPQFLSERDNAARFDFVRPGLKYVVIYEDNEANYINYKYDLYRIVSEHPDYKLVEVFFNHQDFQVFVFKRG